MSSDSLHQVPESYYYAMFRKTMRFPSFKSWPYQDTHKDKMIEDKDTNEVIQ